MANLIKYKIPTKIPKLERGEPNSKYKIEKIRANVNHATYNLLELRKMGGKVNEDLVQMRIEVKFQGVSSRARGKRGKLHLSQNYNKEV